MASGRGEEDVSSPRAGRGGPYARTGRAVRSVSGARGATMHDQECSLESAMDSRLPWPEYFMKIAHIVAERSTCLRRKVGAVAVKDRRILATGYNGAPSGLAHCLDIGCLREKLKVPSGERHELCRALHAEQNVIVQAARHGINIEGSTIYCTTQPCLICTKMLINVGVREIYFQHSYPDELSREMIRESGIVFSEMPDGCAD
jgi:dCMP deaminase